MPQKSLLQKVISISDINTYINNIYGGTIGGFISYSGDMKDVYTMFDVFHGLRLDYQGTSFSENDFAYGVLRFYTDEIDSIEIPYCPQMGGKHTDSYPFGGGGFTLSSLGNGGFPEYCITQI